MTTFYKEVELVQDDKTTGTWWDKTEKKSYTAEQVRTMYYTNEGAFCESCERFIDFNTADPEDYMTTDDDTCLCKECAEECKHHYYNTCVE